MDATALAQQARIVRILARTAFKLRYADSILGYFWSLARPFALFLILYVVFGRALGLADTAFSYPIFLLLGIVLFTYFTDATIRGMSSIVDQNPLLRRLAFPRLIIPISASVTVLINFALSLVAAVIFIAWSKIVPRVEWLLLFPLFLELFFFSLGVALLLAPLNARFRDVGVIWELALRVFFYASAIIFPLQVLPAWAQKILVVIPFGQILQDVRAIVLDSPEILTVADVLGGPIAYAVPLMATALLVVGALAFFKRQESWFAEQV